MNKFQPAFKKGAMMAAVGIIIFLILYAIDPMYFARPIGWFTLLAVNFLALPIVLQIMALRFSGMHGVPKGQHLESLRKAPARHLAV